MKVFRAQLGRFLLGGTFAFLLFSGEASATVARFLSLEQLASRSALVVRGRVVSVRVEWSAPPSRHPMTLAVLEVAATLQGPDRDGSLIRVRQLGGALEGLVLDFAGRPRLEPGEEMVLFLKPDGLEEFVIVGMAQGAFRVVGREEAEGPWLTRDLRGMTFIEGETGVLEPGLPPPGGRVRLPDFREALGVVAPETDLDR